MADETLSKLKIDKNAIVPTPLNRSRRWLLWGGVAATVLVIAMFLLQRNRGIVVESTGVVQTFPAQSFTLLNASGYLVAQRKAAVAAKVTGRLEWLGVEEGSKVKAGQILARLENLDLRATLDQSEAAHHAAKASLDQVIAERDDAVRAFDRQKELIDQGIVARSEYEIGRAHV